MNKNITTATYIGAGCDTQPLDILTNVTDFVFIDSQTRSESSSEEYSKKFYKLLFIKNLINEMFKKGFNIKNKTILIDLSLPYKFIKPKYYDPGVINFSDKKEEIFIIIIVHSFQKIYHYL